MASLGKKILSAFVEVETPVPQPQDEIQKGDVTVTREVPVTQGIPVTRDRRFSEYFDKLFQDANIPGPDYYEFSLMIRAMQAIPNEASRYLAAFAGLQVQGLDRAKLLSTAAEYLRILDADANQFHSTVTAALQEKVQARKTEVEEKHARIESLTKEIAELENKIRTLEQEIGDNEEKLSSRNSAYDAEHAERRASITTDIQKINNYIQ